MEIMREEDLSVFKKNPMNREINPVGLKKIIDSIQKKNLLDLRPILVNEKMEVIDGQHRLEAAKILRIPIYYYIKEGISSYDLIRINAQQQNWELRDYAELHAKNGNINYIKLLSFVENGFSKFNLNLRALGYIDGGDKSTNFRDGFFKFPSKEIENEAQCKISYIKLFVDEIRLRTSGNKKYLNSLSFTNAMLTFFSEEVVNKEVFIEKAKMQIYRFYQCGTKNQYLDLFLAIYNYRNKNPIPVDLFQKKSSAHKCEPFIKECEEFALV